MAKPNHYTRRQRQQVIRFWYEVAIPQNLLQNDVSKDSAKIFGFHVPASTLSLWIKKSRRPRKPAQKTVGPSRTVRVPVGEVMVELEGKQIKLPIGRPKINQGAIRDTRTEKQLLATLIAEQRETNATLNVIARHLHSLLETKAAPLPVMVGEIEKSEARKPWRLW